METELRTRTWQLELAPLLVTVSVSSPASMETQVRAPKARQWFPKAALKITLSLALFCL